MSLFNLKHNAVVQLAGWWKMNLVIAMIVSYIDSLGENQIVVRDMGLAKAVKGLVPRKRVNVTFPYSIYEECLRLVTPYAKGISKPENGAFALMDNLAKDMVDGSIEVEEGKKMFINIRLKDIAGESYRLERKDGKVQVISSKSVIGKGAATNSQAALDGLKDETKTKKASEMFA